MPQNKLLGSNASYTYGSLIQNSTDILLLGLGSGSGVQTDFTSDLNNLTENSGLLQQIYPENKSFPYVIQQYDNISEFSITSRVLLKEEQGIGKIQKNGNNYYLKRDYPLRYYNGNDYYASYGSAVNFLNQGTFIIASFVPSQYNDALFYENSVLCSNEYRGPLCVDLPPSSVLGRINDNIQSLDSNELRQILTDAIVREIIESSTGNYTFLCQTLNLANSNSRLSSAALQARPVYNNSNRPAPQRGSIIYNDQTNRFEGYDGTSWRPFAWASGIGPPYV